MQDSRIKILRDRPPFRIAPTESAFLQPSPPGRPSERGRFRIGDSDTEAGELAQSFAQIYEKIRHFSKFYTDYFSSAIGDPNSNPQKHLAGLLADSPCSPSARGRAETSGIGRREKPKRFREDRAYPENRQGRVHSENTPPPCVLCKTFSPGRARVPNAPGLRRNEKTTVADRRYSASVSYPSRPAPHISRKTSMPTTAMPRMPT